MVTPYSAATLVHDSPYLTVWVKEAAVAAGAGVCPYAGAGAGNKDAPSKRDKAHTAVAKTSAARDTGRLGRRFIIGSREDMRFRAKVLELRNQPGGSGILQPSCRLSPGSGQNGRSIYVKQRGMPPLHLTNMGRNR
jgi:hypothetical protein